MRSFLLLLFCLLLLTGCAVVQVKPEGRVASDQILVAAAIEDAVKALDLTPAVADRKVLLRMVSQATVKQDLDYLTEALRIRVSQCGGQVVAEGHAVELVVMVQAVGSDIDESSVALPIPLPTVGSVALSKVQFYVDSKQISRCRLAVYAFDPEGRALTRHGPSHVAHRVRNPVLFGWTLGKFSDIEELDTTTGTVPITEPGLTSEEPPMNTNELE